ncbi:MAG: NAD(P)H-quinone oxidoreductase subunit F [Candidatus Synechococcus spongiarum 15L]|uniref:NAD(P)H-quinone oxidoreductase subunit F n=2 Tax=Candidatus Synechococcus spongiarum TaxID=431041 RepID=A0A1T1D320_9SYNE|nr:NAD(P)H-quinone oxidoreductase subunit F [Candidatus Synechococcus spongiarum]KKZ13552.1 MAG: NAD(P)H-quinone oxidoreductase subunit F [Candidatus Synechococcus spongiarum 15L]OOV35241.1 NAD(P)H-quinone oxidoreductase subunit F [Candidatus Synechococcus spongiarum LMB bulk15N]
MSAEILSPPFLLAPEGLAFALVRLAWLIPVYGFAGMLLSLPWAAGWIRRNGPRPAAYLNLLVTLLAFIHGSVALAWVWGHGHYDLSLSWLHVLDLQFDWDFRLSRFNLGALELVTGLSFLGQVYALGYLDKEWSLARFFALLGFFEGAMCGVVLSSSLFMSYFLLEMLTLSTYLLVGFWYAQPLVVTAARDAFLTKRVGDVLMLMGIVAISSWAGSLDFDDLNAWFHDHPLGPVASTLMPLALIAGPTGKCAQFPMHLWLDEAMEGPNPASILRNSVVVTCGAIVLLKVMPIVTISPVAMAVLQVIGGISATGGSLVALAQVDIKRALSYTTTAYLGLVFILISLKLPATALLLLLAHALSKALLTMSIGSVILISTTQDLTELGGFGSRTPATTTAYVVGALGMTGLLPLGCFWCFGLATHGLASQPWLAAVVLVTNTLTVWNLLRQFRHIFLGSPLPKTRRAPEVNWLMAVPMVALTVIVLLSPLLMQSLYPVPGIAAFPTHVTALVVASGGLGVVIGCLQPLRKSMSRSIVKPVRLMQDLLAYDFYTDRVYRFSIVRLVSSLAQAADWMDRVVVNGVANGMGRLSLASAEGLKLGVSGASQTYVLTVVAAVVLLLLLVLSRGS